MRYAPPLFFSFFGILIPAPMHHIPQPDPHHDNKPLRRSSTKTEPAGLGFGLFPFVSLHPIYYYYPLMSPSPNSPAQCKSVSFTSDLSVIIIVIVIGKLFCIS